MRRNGLRGNREGALSRGDGDRVAAVQVVIFAVQTGAVARQAADAAADADEIRVRRQGHRADVASVLHAHRFAADPDLARDAGALNRASRQPARVFQIVARRLTGCAVELIHPPVIAHIPIALKLLDHLTDGELPGDTRPHVAVLVTGIYDHVRIGVPQHPADGVHRFVVHDADQRHLHACQLDVGRQEIHPFLVMKHPFSMGDGFILYGFYHKIVQRNRQFVRLPAKA